MDGYTPQNHGWDLVHFQPCQTVADPFVNREYYYIDYLDGARADGVKLRDVGENPADDRSSAPNSPNGNLYAVGIDTATLTPEMLDLNLFPSFPLSENLALKPSLAYGQDYLWVRAGILAGSAPKNWHNHYGELVRVVANTMFNDYPMGPVKEASVIGPREAVGAELQTYFVNAEGQEVHFYPDPAAFSSADPFTPKVHASTGKPHLAVWYSLEGNYRLTDQSPANGESSQFQLRTPGGLSFEFEKYLVLFDVEHDDPSYQSKEWLSIHYRVTRIGDRYGNQIQVSYDDSCGAFSLRPRFARAFKADNLSQPLVTIEYEYDSEGWLKQIHMPRYAETANLMPAQRNTFAFYYPDEVDDLGHSLADISAVNYKPLAGAETLRTATYQSGSGTVRFNGFQAVKPPWGRPASSISFVPSTWTWGSCRFIRNCPCFFPARAA